LVSGEAWLIAAVVTIGLGSVLACLGQSLRDLSRTGLEEIAAIRNRPARTAKVQAILKDVDGHALAIGLPRSVCNLVVTAALVLWVADVRTPAEESSVVKAGWVDMAIGVGLASVVLWVFAVVLPNAVARHAGETTVYAWAGFIRVMRVGSTPLMGLTRVMNEVVRRLAGGLEKNEAEQLQEEILSVVDEAQEEGQFDQTERDMIEAVVRFRDKTAAQVMTPRTEIEAMELSNNLGVVSQTIKRIGHSRIPVYEEDMDHIVGIFYVKDLMRWLAGDAKTQGRTFDLKALLRPAMFVPETKPLRELLRELLQKRVHIAVVADEYGGTAGIVTIEDIVEEVFGDIHDEYEEPAKASGDIVLDVPQGAAEVDARAYIEDVNDALRPLSIELPESEDYDTVGGFVTVHLGRIPQAGERFVHGEIAVVVLAAEPTRVTKVRLTTAHGRAGTGTGAADAGDAGAAGGSGSGASGGIGGDRPERGTGVPTGVEATPSGR
jgi:putative hemolysin